MLENSRKSLTISHPRLIIWSKPYIEKVKYRTMPESVVNNLFTAYFFRLLIICILTWLVARVGSWLAVRVLTARALTRRQVIEERRLLTLQSLVGGAVGAGVYIIGFISALLALAIPPGSILTALGLFSAAFGLGARPIISDYLAGVILIFEDQFAVGDKVEMMEVMGIVEAVNLRTTQVRATSGELYIVPNGDVRIVRNLSRGTFSIASIRVTVASEDLSKALQVFESIADTAQDQLHDLVERPEFVSEEGVVSSQVELTLLAKAAYGRGARLRTQLMAWVIDALDEAGVRIIG